MSQLEALATFRTPVIQIANLTVTSVPQSAVFGDPLSSAVARLRISNFSTTATIAITLGDRAVTTVPQVRTTTTGSSSTATAYTGTAMVASASTAVAAGDGIRIGPGAALEINVSLGTRVWVVASAAGTPVQIAAILQNG
jgi:hypothetical protein